uniref:Alkaline phosphatase n=1 Tax=Kwoniella bestiolae CBS 10118 TaxID=1296100 RepID=A0A1B9G1F3_9TREE|nr:hypothetical protein I302_06301 [Kwoniella bestiolae CBS 10118]OCF24840.1 hypothetical protein I302_06301 [Kwoniella bestiolae CBS 10118]
MYGLIFLYLAGLAVASIDNNKAYDSPSFKAPQLAHRRGEIRKNHKRWEYYDGKIDFPWGIASGDPLSDSVILWTHPLPSTEDPRPVCLEYQVSKNPDDWSNIVASDQVWTTQDVDYSYKVEPTGLERKTTYYYRFVNCAHESNVSPVGKFKITPEEDDDEIDKLALGVFSCSNYPYGFFNAYANAAKRDAIDYVVHLGDYIYEYQADGCKEARHCYGDGQSMRVKTYIPEPNHEIFSLEDYRTRYKSWRSDADLQALHQSHAWQLIWEDHEVANNTWKAGSADSNDTVAGTYYNVSFTEKKANALKAYFEWLPIRTVDADDGLRIWRNFKFGTLADLIMLDMRQYNRDLTDLYYNTDEIRLLREDEHRSLMGGRQEKWFYDRLKNASERGCQWKIIGQQIVFANFAANNIAAWKGDNPDAWTGYEANRQRMLNTISENNIDNVIVISGDSHANWVSDITWENRTGYNTVTGDGALAVKFAGTAVSSPSSWGYNNTLNGPYPPEYYLEIAKGLVETEGNDELQWAEGAT